MLERMNGGRLYWLVEEEGAAAAAWEERWRRLLGDGEGERAAAVF